MDYQITKEKINCYREHLCLEKHSRETVEKYVRDLKAFQRWLGGREAEKENVLGWKEYLLTKGYAPVTINSMLSSLNGFFRFMRWEDCRMKFLRIQHRLFRSQEKELTRKEYECLLDTARKQKKNRLALLMETICSTGIRVSEVQYITVEAVKKRKSEVFLKGKIRTIFLPGKLCRKLLLYAKRERIASGEIFLTKNKKSLSRHQIWQEMKKLCMQAHVEPSKVFPHNLRHLFAVTFYRISRDIVKLADLLGHSCMETTRIYLLSTGEEHIRQLERMKLVM